MEISSFDKTSYTKYQVITHNLVIIIFVQNMSYGAQRRRGIFNRAFNHEHYVETVILNID